MANDIIYSTYDAGNVVIFDNAVYIKEGEVNHFPERGKKDSDKEYTSVTFNYDDNNELSGIVHNVWTAEEMAIAHLDEHHGTVMPRFSGNSTKEIIAPIGGIFRYYAYFNDYGIKIYLNDADISIDGDFLHEYIEDSVAIKVLKGDRIKIDNTINSGSDGYACYWFFLPYQYPYE